ncbi:MAG: ABC transporter ATP-binding protein [Verrucomicrobiota bacterium]|nr:ABC transporter ATP-binding protein [Verrucomicrobiota bacterium]
MFEVAIRVENLGKSYKLGGTTQKGARYRTLRDTLAEGAQHFFRRNRSTEKHHEFWALRDVSFNVQEGEVVGIIGRNGAGKSTLLKILSRITEPTTGKIRIRGRVASLLEVGTGFHPELTGRENVFLNGAILGMSRAEIKARFDEIVAFAEIEQFLDTPVKRYSSGMYVRLAFAVAAYLEPEILIVDEVLAVGDSEFQRKCLGKMREVSQGGRTVLFVSHNLVAVQMLCSRVILLTKGSIAADGTPAVSIHSYQRSLSRATEGEQQAGTQVLSLTASSTPRSEEFSAEKPLFVRAEFSTDRTLKDCYLNLVVKDENGQFLVHTRTDLAGLQNPTFQPGQYRVAVDIPRLAIRAGVYSVLFSIYANGGDVNVSSEPVMLPVEGQQEGGLVQLPCQWSWKTK